MPILSERHEYVETLVKERAGVFFHKHPLELLEAKSLYEKLEEKLTAEDIEEIDIAADVLSYALEGQRRKSTGLPQSLHSWEIAHALADLGIFDRDLFITALLHDVPEDSDKFDKRRKITSFQLAERFGQRVGQNVEALRKVKRNVIQNEVQANRNVEVRAQGDTIQNHQRAVLYQKQRDESETHYKIIFGTFGEKRKTDEGHYDVLLIKLLDKWRNSQDLHGLSPESLQGQAKEILEFYAPFAYKVGLYDIGRNMAENCLRECNPVGFKDLQERIHRIFPEEILKEFSQKFRALQKTISRDIHSIELHAPTVYQLWRQNKMSWEGIEDSQIRATAKVVLSPNAKDGGEVLSYIRNNLWDGSVLQTAKHIHKFVAPLPTGSIAQLDIQMDNGQEPHVSYDVAGRPLTLRFLDMYRDLHEQASLIDYYRFRGSEDEESLVQVAGDKLTRLKANLNRLREGNTKRGVVEYFIGDLNAELILITGKDKNKKFAFPKGATFLDAAPVFYYNLPVRAVAAYVVQDDGTRIEYPLEAQMPDNVTVEIEEDSDLTADHIPDANSLDYVITPFAKRKIREHLEKKISAERRRTKEEPHEVLDSAIVRGKKTILNHFTQEAVRRGLHDTKLMFDMKHAAVVLGHDELLETFYAAVGLDRQRLDSRGRDMAEAFVEHLISIQQRAAYITIIATNEEDTEAKITHIFGSEGINLERINVGINHFAENQSIYEYVIHPDTVATFIGRVSPILQNENLVTSIKVQQFTPAEV